MSKKRPSPSSKRSRTNNAPLIYVLAAAATLLWIGGLFAYVLGLRAHVGPFANESFAFTLLALLGLAPVGLVWIGAYALLQGARLLAEAARLQALSEEMLAPAALASARAGSAVDAIRLEIGAAGVAADKARTELLALRDALAHESGRLAEVSAEAAREAAGVVESLGQERQAFGELSGQLESRIGEVGGAIARHARLVAEAADLAQAQVNEAQAALVARTADLTLAAGAACDAARSAGEDISEQALRLEQAGIVVSEQANVAGDTLSQQRAALVALAHALRAEQEDLAVRFESQRAQLLEVLRQSGHSVEQAGEAAQDGARTLQGLVAAIAEQLRIMGQQANAERERMGQAALHSLGMFSQAVAGERLALEQDSRRAIDALSASAEMANRAVEAASGDLMASARSASEELQSIENAFKERVQRNYEMLSEAVRLMSVLSGGMRPPQPLSARAPMVPPLPLRPRDGLRAPDDDFGQRPRLRLTPADDGDDDEEMPPPPPEGELDVTWSELKSALGQLPADEADLERQVIAQIEALGIDAAALIPRRRIDDVALLYEGGDLAGARDAIHRLAPAAVGKLARRVLSDPHARLQAELLLRRYAGLLQGAAKTGGDGLSAANLLSSDAGRAFLLLDAAAGDLS